MICPNCGEPVQTRHLFCVVCGADLKDVTSEKAGVRLKQALTKPIAAKKAAKEKPAEQEAQRQDFTAVRDPLIYPDFMHRYT